ncbi:type II secretion system protein GspL [Thalassotalea crassostreae]|uniref:type II secretion system protein GspL n=1 Tax=Thalassotalea crassostreae TaxID=1763536 RepID=UPI00083995E6|nr:type II secretion system protein GspL [Thalassotalea crassostreae]
MKETLYIRISSQEQMPIQWLIAADLQSDELASGELANKGELVSLAEKAENRDVVVLADSANIGIYSLNVPGKSDRVMRATIPYTLEDDLAEDVESLFFAYANKPKDYRGNNNNFFTVIAHQQMELWLSWFKEAGIAVKTMIPDVLTLPQIDNNPAMISLNQQWLVRTSSWGGFNIDNDFAELVLAQKLAQKLALTQQTKNSEQESEQPNNDADTTTGLLSTCIVDCYSPQEFVIEDVEFNSQAEELPLLLMARGAANQAINLLQGQYLVKDERSPVIKNWLWVAGVAAVALTLNIVGKVIEISTLDNKIAQVNESIEANYKKAFPQTKRVRLSTLKRTLSREIENSGGGSTTSGMLAMMAQVQPAFSQVPNLKPESVRFDGKRSELRLSVTANDYQSFEKFKSILEDSSLTVTVGAQNNQGDKVTGSFSIRSN